MQLVYGKLALRQRSKLLGERFFERLRRRSTGEPPLHGERTAREAVEPRLRPHPHDDALRVAVGDLELLDARRDQLDGQLVDLAQRSWVQTRERRHRWARIGLDEIGLRFRACMELPQAEHLLVLVAKGTQVGDAQRC
jgi:hypothetical protein